MERIYHPTSLYIVESLASDEHQTGTELYERFSASGNRLIGVFLGNVASAVDLASALTRVLEAARSGEIPLLHLEVHGSKAGIVLASGECLSWSGLAGMLRPINRATGCEFVTVLACCQGIDALFGFETDDMCPCAAIVGCEGDIWSDELLDGYVAFYQTVMNSNSIQTGIAALQGKISRSSGTRQIFYPCERAFIRVIANLIRHHEAPYLREQRIRRMRKQGRKDGKKTKLTNSEIGAVIDRVHQEGIQNFYRRFFGIGSSPDAAAPFPLEALVESARAHMMQPVTR